MALQTSGAISISQIKTELSSSSNSLRALSAAAGKSTPDAMSEFYGFSSYTPPTISGNGYTVSGAGTVASPYDVNVTSGYYYADEVDPDFGVQRYDVNGPDIRFNVQQSGTYNIYFDPISASVSGVRGDGNDTAYIFWRTYTFGMSADASGAGFNEVSLYKVIANYNNGVQPAVTQRALTAGNNDGPYIYMFQYWDPITINSFRFKMWFELV